VDGRAEPRHLSETAPTTIMDGLLGHGKMLVPVSAPCPQMAMEAFWGGETHSSERFIRWFAFLNPLLFTDDLALFHLNEFLLGLVLAMQQDKSARLKDGVRHPISFLGMIGGISTP
jgi:hypothetical protein